MILVAIAVAWLVVDHLIRRRYARRGIAAVEEFLAGAWEALEDRQAR